MQMDDAIQLFMFQFVTELYTLDDPLRISKASPFPHYTGKTFYMQYHTFA